MTNADLIIKNGIVLTMDSSGTQIENGFVAIAGDTISAVGRTEELAGFSAGKTIDAKGGVIMPGLVNTHTHAAMTCFRGLADDLPLMTWLHDHIFPAEARLDADKVYKGTKLACAEMILSGTTTFCDMYLFEDAVARAVNDCGMRAIVGEALYDFPSPNYGSLENGFDYIEKLIAKWAGHPLVTIGLTPHSPYLCAPELLKKAAGIAEKNGIPFIIHVSETQSEVEQITERYGMTPVEFLAENGLLAPNLLACHCVVLTDNDIALLKKFDVKVSHNPESNMKLGSGIAPVEKLIESGITVGIGTDGCASNNDLDLFLEMDSTAKLHKVKSLDPSAMDAGTVLEMATAKGAAALGLGGITGSIEAGKKADIIIVDTNKPHLTPMYNPVSHMVYAAGGSDVSTSVINGRVVMEDRRLLTIDIDEAMRDVREIAAEIAAIN